MLLVTGTTVTTPRPSRAAVAFARSLLTTTAGRCLFASLPRAGSKSTCQISPRSITETVVCRRVPERIVAVVGPFSPGVAVVVLEFGMPEHADGATKGRRPRRQPGALDVCVQRFHIFFGKADTQFHTRILLR